MIVKISLFNLIYQQKHGIYLLFLSIIFFNF